MTIKPPNQEAIIIPFKDKRTRDAEIRFRHLSDHLYANPCFKCSDVNTEFCLKECASNKYKS